MPRDDALQTERSYHAARASRARVAAYVVSGLVFAGHLAFGANRTSFALGFSTLWFLSLPLLVASQPWAREALSRARIGALAALFAIVMALAALSLTSVDLGGPHPVWSYVPGALATTSLDPYATGIEMLKLTCLATVFVAGCLFGAEDERAKTLLRAVLVVGLAFSAWAFLDHVLNPGLLFGSPRAFGPGRLSAAFGSGNTAATLFGALTLLNLTDLVRTYEGARQSSRFHISHLRRLAPRLARPLLGLGLAATCLVLTLSRAGLIATFGIAVVLIGAMAFFRARPTAVSAPMLATGAILGGLIAASIALNIDALGERFSILGSDSLSRGQVVAAHWAAVRAAPWSGYGLGSFAHVNGLIMDRANFAALATIGAVHNLYVQWLEEAGAPASVVMFGLVTLIAVRMAITAVRKRRMRSWILSVMAVLALFALHGASDYALQTPSMAIFLSLLLGIGYGLADRPAPSVQWAAEPMMVPRGAGARRARVSASGARAA